MRLALRPRALVLLLFLAAGCSRDSAGKEVWFVHATDPHLFHPQGDQEKRRRAEREDQTAFDDLLKAMASRPANARPRFLVVTGDFGIDAYSARPALPPGGKTPPPTAPKWPPKFTPQSDGVWEMVRLLRASPVRHIYFVPGNNDVEMETTAEDSLAVTHGVLAAVQAGLGSSVKLHDLTSCYFGGQISDDNCIAEIEGTPFRLVGFPSHSFKNSDTPYETNRAAQETYLEKLSSLVEKASAKGGRALIVTHIPELDDPHRLEEWRQGKLAQEGSQRPQWAKPAAWNVPDGIYGKWKEIVGRDEVAGVLAGHFHDSRRQLYYPPYGWSTAADRRPDPNKVFVAPPLSAKFQEAAPMQARGFALFRVADGQLERRLFWYDAGKRAFEPDPGGPTPKPGPSRLFGGDLGREALIALAFLLALLTVLQLWEVEDGGKAGNGGNPPAFSNVLKTIVTGLGGLFVAQALGFTQSTGSTSVDGRAFYAIWFVVFFCVLLILYAVARGVVESRKPAPAPRFASEFLAILRGRRE